jgi:glycine cleavage system H protein
MDPKSLRFTTSHEWVHIDGDIATVGISRFAVDQLSDLIQIELPKVGARVTSGKGFGEVESVKSVSDLYAPMSGEVVEVNTVVSETPQLLADDPYDNGWLIRIKVDPASPTADLLDHDAYERYVAENAH